MKINKLKKLSKSRYKLIFDNNDTLILYEDVILKHNLLLKKEIDVKTIESIIKDNYYYTIYNESLRYINIRMRSKKELIELLLKKYNEKDNIDKVIYQLEKEGYINDKEFCKCYINDRLYLSNDGIYKIKNTLSYYNIDDNIIESVINNIDFKVLEGKLYKLIEKYIRTNNKYSNNQLKNKVLNYFINLGYDKDMILNIYNSFDIKQDDSIIKKEYNKLYNKYSKKYTGYKLDTYIKSRLFQKGFSIEEIEKIKTP